MSARRNRAMSEPAATPLLANSGPGCCRFIIASDYLAAIRRRLSPYCGKPTAPGVSWCTEHRQIVFTKPQAPVGDGFAMPRLASAR